MEVSAAPALTIVVLERNAIPAAIVTAVNRRSTVVIRRLHLLSRQGLLEIDRLQKFCTFSWVNECNGDFSPTTKVVL
jgi:hypothetical protein